MPMINHSVGEKRKSDGSKPANHHQNNEESTPPNPKRQQKFQQDIRIFISRKRVWK